MENNPLPAFTAARSLTALLALALTLGMAGCAPAPSGAGGFIHDPYESQNRRVHAFNRSLDARVFGGGTGAGAAQSVPPELAASVGNLSDTLSLPGVVVNNLLQGDVPSGFRNSVRFAVNAVLGFGGLFDPAADFGIAADDTDFGETLHVWGVPEGAYLELPVLGPSTQRDTAGRIVDLFTNPLSYVLDPPESYLGTASRLADRALNRGRYAGTVDSVLHDSADSYAQARLIYLQKRRHELGMTGAGLATGTPAGPGAGQSINPYEDPYAE